MRSTCSSASLSASIKNCLSSSTIFLIASLFFIGFVGGLSELLVLAISWALCSARDANAMPSSRIFKTQLQHLDLTLCTKSTLKSSQQRPFPIYLLHLQELNYHILKCLRKLVIISSTSLIWMTSRQILLSTLYEHLAKAQVSHPRLMDNQPKSQV